MAREEQVEHWLARVVKNVPAALLGAALSLLSRPGPGLWEALAAAPALSDPGFLGFHLWRVCFGEAGTPGVAALRAALVFTALLPLPAPPRVGRSISDWTARIAWTAILAFLAPWGPDAFLYPLAAWIIALAGSPGPVSPSRSAVVGLLALFWPLLDPCFFFGAAFAALVLAPTGRRAAFYPILSLLNPAGLLALVSGAAFTPLAASWVAHPAFSASFPSAPAFWLAILPALALFYGFWRESGRLSGAVSALALGLALKPLSALPAALCLATPPEDPTHQNERRGIFGSASAVAALPFLVWLALFPPQTALPSGAAEALRRLPAGPVHILSEPRWRGEVAFLLGKAGETRGASVSPRFGISQLLRFHASWPAGLVPPFEGESVPEADFLLLGPSYPEIPFPRALQAGWRLCSAGPDWALFASEAGPMAGWTRENALQAYSPFGPLPQDEALRKAAFMECEALIEREPLFFEALRDAGRLATDLGRLDRAEIHIDRAIRLKPRDGRLWNDLAVALQFAGRTGDAETAYLKAVSLTPIELLPRMNLAGLLAGTGRQAEAESVLADILRVHPQFFPARRMRVQILLSLGRREEAAREAALIPADSRSPQEDEMVGSP